MARMNDYDGELPRDHLIVKAKSLLGERHATVRVWEFKSLQMFNRYAPFKSFE
jgi:hypothetical protein